ncbi:MAG TPA: outer membrane beta-barrel protein, partial [Bryobacteraceae bacterium]|nr:outer membrane beta-barrel protein [Bryobacteraceae bacterium]
MKNRFAPYGPACLTRLALSAMLLASGAVDMYAQAAPTSQDVQALAAEIGELKSRLAAVEAKLAAYQTVPAVSPGKPAVEPQPPTPTASAPNLSAVEQSTTKPAPFAFGDFTWMNGQNRQKSQPLSNSFATVNLYLDTYYGYSFNHPRDDTIVGSGAVGRNTEWQINNATVGIDTNYKNVIGKITLQAGNQLAVTQDLDGTVNRG